MCTKADQSAMGTINRPLRFPQELANAPLTDEWKDRGAKEGLEFAILTNELSNGTFGMTVSVYKDYKLLPARANLRDH